jgi:ribokinase
MDKRIVVVGSINLDLVATSPHIPSPGQTIFGTDFQTFCGGKGANQAVAAARLGAPVTMIGRVGEDSFGTKLIEGLRAAGVQTDCIARTPGSSGIALIVTDAKGENSIVVIPGANGQLKPADLEKYDVVLKNAGIILTQLEIPFDTVEFLADRAQKHDVPLILDPAPARVMPPEVLAKFNWLTPNETEAAILYGSVTDSFPSEQVAELLQQRGAHNVVLKLGARGVLVKQAAQPAAHMTGFSVQAIDTTAAGDAFNGAFACGLLNGKPAAASARFANAVAAISVTRRGAQSSMPDWSEVQAFLSQHSQN